MNTIKRKAFKIAFNCYQKQKKNETGESLIRFSQHLESLNNCFRVRTLIRIVLVYLGVETLALNWILNIFCKKVVFFLNRDLNNLYLAHFNFGHFSRRFQCFLMDDDT